MPRARRLRVRVHAPAVERLSSHWSLHENQLGISSPRLRLPILLRLKRHLKLALILTFLPALSFATPALAAGEAIEGCVAQALEQGARSLDPEFIRTIQSAKRGAELLRGFSEIIDPTLSKRRVTELAAIARAQLALHPESEMTGKDFNTLFDALNEFATRAGVQITQTHDTLGVFPKGLFEIALSGFGRSADARDTAPVGFAKRHELAHLFHTVLVRAILIQSLAPDRLTIPPELVQRADEFLKVVEGGGNYLEFEKAVTGMASPVVGFSAEARSNRVYLLKLEALLNGTSEGMGVGKVRFLNGTKFEEVYALVISRLPLVVGTSLGGLTYRLPLIFFAVAYLANLDVTKYGFKPDPEDERRGRSGFRDYVNRLLASHP